MNQISRIGLDTSKAVFTLHAVDDAGQPMLRVLLHLPQREAVFFSVQSPCHSRRVSSRPVVDAQ